MKSSCCILLLLPFLTIAQAVKLLPQIFLPGIVSTGNNERDMAIAPNGKDMFYTLQSPRLSFSVILHRTMKNGQWQKATVAWFSGQYQDLEPAFSPDGNKLFFASNRPIDTGRQPKDFDIWYLEKKTGGWSAPINAGPLVNSRSDEFYPSVTTDGSIYFTATRADTIGQDDIYKSQWKDNHFQEPVNIGSGVNSVFDEYNAFIDPQERFILFSVEGPIDQYQGRGDLCISYRNRDGSWTKAASIGAAFNSDRLDYCPFVYKDVLYFTSERVRPFNSRQRSVQQVKNKLNSYGNGYGDIYYLPLSTVVDTDKIVRRPAKNN